METGEIIETIERLPEDGKRLRLLACAFATGVCHGINTDQRLKTCIDVSIRYALSMASTDELKEAEGEAHDAACEASAPSLSGTNARTEAANVALLAANTKPWGKRSAARAAAIESYWHFINAFGFVIGSARRRQSINKKAIAIVEEYF